MNKDLLWPYSRNTAILLVPLSWIFFLVLFALTARFLGWPDENSRNTVIIAVLIVSFLPVILFLLDFLSSRRASVSTNWFEISFAHFDFNQANVRRESFGLPANIGVPGAIVADSSPMEIQIVLKEAIANEVVRVDLKEGDEWWVTRLLALTAGAERAGSPKAMVFIGTKANSPGIFLGWINPAAGLKAMLKSNAAYKSRYILAKRIALQVNQHGDSNLWPPNFSVHQEVSQYINSYGALGEAAFEQIFMDLLRKNDIPGEPGAASLEDPPDRLTLRRLYDLFEPFLYEDQIDLGWPNDKQISFFLESQAPYIALLKEGKFDSLLERNAGQALILRELYSSAQAAAIQQ